MRPIRHIAASAYALLACTNLFAQEADKDTLIVNRPHTVTVTSDANNYKISIDGSAENPDYRYERIFTQQKDSTFQIFEQERSWDFSMPFNKKKEKYRHKNDIFSQFGVGLGMIHTLNTPENMNTKMGASFEITSPCLIGWRHRPWRDGNSFSIGVGINWKNYRMTGLNRFVQEGSHINVDTYPEGADIRYSRIKVFSWTMPIMYNREINDAYGIPMYGFSLGAIINFNTYGSLETKYSMDGENQRFFSKNIRQNPVTVDLQAMFRISAVGFYFKYSPSNVLDTDFGVPFNALSTGIGLWF